MRLLSVSDLDSDQLYEVNRSLFYGFAVLAAASTILPYRPEVFISMAALASVSLVSAGLSSGLEEDWEDFLRGVSVITLLLLVTSLAWTVLQVSLF